MMERVKAIYVPNAPVALVMPNMKHKSDTETDDEFFERCYQKTLIGHPEFAGHPHENIDKTSLPTTDRDKWRGAVGQGVNIDPTVVTSRERRAAVVADLDAELDGPGGNPIEALKLQRKLDTGNY